MKKKVIILIVIIIIIIAVTCFVTRNRSALTEIYNAAKTNNLKKFNKVTALENVSERKLVDDEVYGILYINYKKEYIKENYNISLFFPAKREYIKIISRINIDDDTTLLIRIKYHHNDRIIIYEPLSILRYENHENPDKRQSYNDLDNVMNYLHEYDISKKNISEYQKYILYDVVIKTWTDTYGGNYNKQKKYVETLETLDNTYNFDDDNSY